MTVLVRVLPADRTTGPPAPLLVYDADCGFCTRSAMWLQKRMRGDATAVPWQGLDLAEWGLTIDDVTAAAWWIDRHGVVGAHLAIAAALSASRAPWPVLGAVISHRPVSWAAAPVYRWIAVRRHEMPGGTDACKL